MKIWWLRILLGISILSAVPVMARQGGRASLLAPLLLEGDSLGDVWTYPAATEEQFELGTNSLLPALEKALTRPAFEQLLAKAAGRQRLSLAWLRAQQVQARFDEAALVLHLVLPDALRMRKLLRVRRGLAEGEREALGPEAFSGYVNASANQGFHYPQALARQAFQGSLSGAVNGRGVVLETGATYTEHEHYPWIRDDTRITRDFEGSMMRLSAGDVPMLTTAYQNSRALGGISLSRQFSMQPYLNTRPLNRTEIQLKRPSVIEVYVNKGYVVRLSAPAGPVQLSDFPLFSGVNQVDLKITDDAGNVEWVNLNLLYDVQVLGEGIQQFAYQLGAPSRPFRQDRLYNTQNMTFSGYHRWGLNDRVTLGGSAQFDDFTTTGGLDTAWLTHPGVFSTELAYSTRSGGWRGSAGKVRYKSLDYKLGQDRPWRAAAEVEYKSPHFSALSDLLQHNEFSWRYDLSVSRPLTAISSLGLGAQYEMNRAGRDDRRSLRSNFNTQINSEWRLSANYILAREHKVEHQFQITLSWVDSSGRYYGNLSYDYPTKTLRAEGTRNASAVVDDFRATLGVQNAPQAARADALLNYIHEKGSLQVEHASNYKRPGPGYRYTDNATTLTASTALAWAGTKVAWSRPIADSFAIVSARPLFRSFDIPVNPRGTTAEARVNRFGAAVVPTLTSYDETPLVLDSGKVPVGYSLGKEYFLARPTYRSGISLEVGGESSAILSGRLLQPGGTPLSLATGTVKRLDSSGKVADIFFTNREGFFVVENLRPGTYEILLDSGQFAPYRFEVTQAMVGIVRLPPHELRKGEL